uniref:P5 protein n=1 Tax=Maize yellow mosaic virus TaxID=1856642 RepID=A0A2R3TWJ6_9VIRU|nr:P5 protein [Maize yellow mosaic virus]
MYYWHDESWSKETMSAGYVQNDSSRATPYFLIPTIVGNYKVYIECEGFQAIKAKGGENNGKMAGFITYDPQQAGWQAYSWAGCSLSNYKMTDGCVQAHPDLKVNGCSFTKGQCVERDVVISFDLSVASEGYWALQAPPIEKSDDHNFIVSYGNYTEKILEWGMVSISIDEINSSNDAQRVPNRNKDTSEPNRLTDFTNSATVGVTVADKNLDSEPEGQLVVQTPSSQTPANSVAEPASKVSAKVVAWLNNPDLESDAEAPPPPTPWESSQVRLRSREEANLEPSPQNTSPREYMNKTYEDDVASQATKTPTLSGGSLRPRLKQTSDSVKDTSSQVGSQTGTLTGGSLRPSLQGGRLASQQFRMTTEQAKQYDLIKRSFGRIRANEYYEECRKAAEGS